MLYKLFPFGDIEKGSNIVLFCAGILGKYYYNEVTNTGYCQIKAVLDNNWKAKTDFPMKVQAPENCKYFPEDYIYVIACISDFIGEAIVEQLLSYGIKKLPV